jgi:hypothetical protein
VLIIISKGNQHNNLGPGVTVDATNSRTYVARELDVFANEKINSLK